MENNTRRKFLKALGISIGAAGIAGSSTLLNSCTRVEFYQREIKLRY